MEWSNYILTVKDQIRNKNAKILVEDELNDHYQEQVKAYQDLGYQIIDAQEKATIDMGDPVEVGARLDRVHRPKLERKLLLIIVFFGFFGLLVQYLLGEICLSVDKPTYFKDQIVFTIIGITVMLITYFFDYTILGKYPLLLWCGLYLIGICYLKFGRWHYSKLIYLFNILYLFVPIFAGVLFQLRKWRMRGLFLSAIIGASPLLLALRGANISAIIHYTIIILIMLNIAVAKKWFGVSRLKGFIFVWGGIAVFVIMSVLFGSRFMNDYQKMRLLAVTGMSTPDESMLYLPRLVEKALANSKIFGKNTSLIHNMPVVESDYVLVFIFNVFGILVGVGLLGLLLFLVFKAYRIAKRQRSYLGFMVATACTLTLFVQILFYCISNLVYSRIRIIIAQQALPFLSGGARNVIFSYAVVGLLLSIHRNSEIINDRIIQSRRKSLFRRKLVN